MSKPFRVLIADSMSSRADEILSASPAVECVNRAGISPEELLECISDFQALLVRSRTKVRAEVIEAGGELKMVGRAGIGVDNVDLQAASRSGVFVVNTPKGNADSTAEHAICLLLSMLRNIPDATASMKDNRWEKKRLAGTEFLGKSFAVLGLGNIGRIVAELGKGLRMRVIACDPYCDQECADTLGVELMPLEQVLAEADFISVHTPLSDSTRGLLSEREFSLMKEGAFLVNASRGGVVDESACLQALESGKLAGAAFDVFAEEPTPANHPLLAHPRVVCTPHLGASTKEAQVKVAEELARQVRDFAESGELRNLVNRELSPG